jgi:catechol 2,3-dioxygenase-like lactoylglutathione lyase family enzyme
MKPTHIEHLGIAVKNLEESIRYYEEVLGLTCYAIEEVADQKVKTAFFRVGDTKIELLESTAPAGAPAPVRSGCRSLSACRWPARTSNTGQPH